MSFEEEDDAEEREDEEEEEEEEQEVKEVLLKPVPITWPNDKPCLVKGLPLVSFFQRLVTNSLIIVTKKTFPLYNGKQR